MELAKRQKYIIQAMGMNSTKYGAIEKFMSRLCQEFSKSNIRLVLIYNTRPWAINFIQDIEKNGGIVLILDALKPFKFMLGFISVLIKYKPLIIHAHFTPHISVAFSKLFFRKNVFLTPHMMFADNHFREIEKITQLGLKSRILWRFSNFFADRIFPVSNALAVQYCSIFPKVKYKVNRFYFGVSPNNFIRKDSKIKYGFPNNKVCIGNISFNNPIKGIRILLNAVAILKKNYKCDEFSLYIIGIEANINKSQDLLTECENKGIKENVVWMGIRNDVPEILAGLDIYCQPSLSECLPLAIIEAGMAGLPAVASRVGGTPEVVIDSFNGFLFKPGDPQEMAEVLFRFISDKQKREEMGRNSKKHMLENFNLEKQTDLMKDFYISRI